VAELEQLRTPELTQITHEVRNDRGADAVLFFLSFDLVNSTEFKNRRPSGWLGLIDNFYSAITKQVTDSIPTSQEWKKAGDEVLFYFQIEAAEQIPQRIQAIADILKSVRRSLKNRPEGKSIVDLKATLWCAHVGRKESGSQNIILPEERGGCDFIGPDIDFGFRISGKSAPGMLCIDPKIVWILKSNTQSDERDEVLSHIRFVGLEQLKGVWNGRYVPILWYHALIHTPDQIFPYDEYLRNPLVTALKKQSSIIELDTLVFVAIDLGFDEDWKKLKQNIRVNEIGITDVIPRERQAEIHIVAVCINHENKVLCAKRSEKKSVYPGLWEFGCAQLKAGKFKIDQMLKEEYEATFAIRISQIIGTPESPVPIGTYGFEIQRYSRWVPGIVFVGIADGIPTNLPTKHSEVSWKSLEEIELISEDSAVPGFHNRVKSALKLKKDSLI
jgi:hypothetical protein